MVALISALLGFAGSALPELVGLFKDYNDRKHELKILELQIRQQESGHMQRLEEIRVAADMAEAQAIYKTYHSGIRWVDAFNASVRPALAYAFFLLYALVKLLQVEAYDAMMPAAITLLWAEEDQAIFAGIISFYFGQRAFGKLRK